MEFVPEIRSEFWIVLPDLYTREGLLRLDAAFLSQLKAADSPLHRRLIDARANPDALARKSQSELLIELAPRVESFLGSLFGITAALDELRREHEELESLYEFKRRFVQKRAISGVTAEHAAAIDGPALADDLEALFGEPLTEASFARHVACWLDDEADHTAALQQAAAYAAWAALARRGDSSTAAASCSAFPTSWT